MHLLGDVSTALVGILRQAAAPSSSGIFIFDSILEGPSDLQTRHGLDQRSVYVSPWLIC